jgi:TonB family protein
MMFSTMLRHIRRTARLVLTGSIPLICAACLFAQDMKRVSQDEAMKAVSYKAKAQESPMAKQLRLSGPVGLDVVIAEDGTVESVTVVSGNPILAKLAVETIKHWKFTPFKSDGKAIKVVSQIVITFNFNV